ncbi:MAG: STN domain-containing protein [Mangrovibacterium sp.]
MKLTLLLLFLTILTSIAADTYSQSTRLSLKMENVRIVNILSRIEDQSQFRFFYNEKINLDQKVSLDASDETIVDILDKIFKDKKIHYEIMGVPDCPEQ